MENLIKEKNLGKGSFGSVFLVRRKTDHQLYALKQVQLSKADFSDRNRALNEVRILASIRHPNIIRFKESFFNSDNTTLNIVTEYADRGDLSMKIQIQKKNNMRIPEDDIWKALHDVAKGTWLNHHRPKLSP
jgi:NIMA (never in mitosis gene a)-related kinase